ncbi:MAG TPA: aldo/keto reductase [Xanthobacteraceae bacterium]|nr:aldo/keto reductase [Xanthobacteraceae bacterium]
MDEMPGLSRRDVMALTAGAAAGALVGAPAQAQTSILARAIPSSGEMLPVVGVGTSIVFNVGNDVEKRKDIRAVLEALVAGGGKLVDTAPSYRTAEEVTGDLMEEARLRDKIFVATKVAVRERPATIAEMQQSQRRLKTQKFELEQLHNVSDAKTDLGLFREWKRQGICRYFGITTSDGRDHAALAAVAKREKPDFVQINYSLGDRDAEKVLPGFRDGAAAVLINMPFGRNQLFRLVRGKALPDWAAEFGAKSWGQFFLKYLIANEAVTAVIPATSKAEHMTDNLGAGRGLLPDKAMRAKMVAFIDGL